MDKDIPYIVFESVQTKNDILVRRLVKALVLTVILLFISNAAWLYAWCQYDYTGTETTYSQDGEGLNIIGDSNDVTEQDSEN